MNKPDWPKLTSVVSAPPGLLVDYQIWTAIGKGLLVSASAEEKNCKYACYELRIGTRIQQLVIDANDGKENDLYREKVIPESGVFNIRPGETFKIYSLEELYIPADVCAITVPVGNLYKLGLNPETSFADPGFSGGFFVTVCNYSSRIVKLKVGDPLARVFFHNLSERPQRIHDGRPRDLPPSVERVQRPLEADLVRRGESAVLQDILAAVDPPHFEHAFVTHRVVSLHREEATARATALERDVASTTLLVLLCFGLVSIIAVLYIWSILEGRYPTFASTLVTKGAVAVLFWVATTFVIPPIRRATVHALRTAFGSRGRV